MEGSDAREVEVKVRVDCRVLDDLAALLGSRGYMFLGERREKDVYLQHPCRDFLERDEALRVRFTAGRPVEVTYKGPRTWAGGVKERLELTITVSQGDPLRLFEALGFREAVIVEKDRSYYEGGGFLVTLDRVEGLGCFVEVESRGGADPLTVVEELGLGGEIVEESYAELLWKRQEGLG